MRDDEVTRRIAERYLKSARTAVARTRGDARGTARMLLAAAAVATAMSVALAPLSYASPPMCRTHHHLCGRRTYIDVLPNDSNTLEAGGRWESAPRSLFVKNYIAGNFFRPSYRFLHLMWMHWGAASASATGSMKYCQRYSMRVPGTSSHCTTVRIRLVADVFEPCPDFNVYARLRVVGTQYVHQLDVAPQACGRP